ncbi:MAG: sugar phosphate isomerase/epimerase [Lentisphaeria bacterium]|nr:sugar phosphate isomerase/epimerase [Lentisphaeria bacterium]
MQYGLAAWGLREEPLESQLAITSGFGLDLLEFSIANYDKDALQLGCSDAEIDNVKNLFARYGVKLECGCTGNDFTGDDVDAQVVKVKAVIDIAAKLGLKILRIFVGFTSDSQVYGERFDKMIAALKSVNDYAAPKGVTLCVETHGGVTCMENGALLHFHSPSTRVDMWKKIAATGVSMTYDPANLSGVGMPAPGEFYKEFKAIIPYMHLKDFKDVPGGEAPAACGEGRLDWKRLWNDLKGYDGPAMIEYEVVEDVKDGMKRSLDFIKNL